MKETYTIPESERENVLKILARYRKKAMAYGTSLTVGAGEPYATKRNVCENASTTLQEPLTAARSASR